ncbi:MAG: hypothetical protein ACT6SF_11765 [Hydrogenophaga sp.]|jgi:hypothetical protein|uniref:hypothetical protein n=1 Tax=Hydrogenophaga sp. TaxID=1904254 RepID=UPI001DE51990|nr:hypothetical protein [Hydrogenophaga sp.]MBW0171671.1 hypothetical protein [Hydrogenophaga sp.]MBW0182530.1 hypothetical protein [Hydrogenophaga sp.]
MAHVDPETDTMIELLKSYFQTPQFAAGTRVNRLHKGSLDRVDGRVVAQTEAGVLVEWPRNGCGWEQPGALCQQG